MQPIPQTPRLSSPLRYKCKATSSCFCGILLRRRWVWCPCICRGRQKKRTSLRHSRCRRCRRPAWPRDKMECPTAFPIDERGVAGVEASTIFSVTLVQWFSDSPSPALIETVIGECRGQYARTHSMEERTPSAQRELQEPAPIWHEWTRWSQLIVKMKAYERGVYFWRTCRPYPHRMLSVSISRILKMVKW